jgi:Transposase DDE domain
MLPHLPGPDDGADCRQDGDGFPSPSRHPSVQERRVSHDWTERAPSLGLGPHEVLPDHSSLTCIRQRWGAELFRRVFTRTPQACVAARIAKGEVVHIDATLIRADAAWESLGEQQADALVAQDADEVADPDAIAVAVAKQDGEQSGKHKKICLTDPDATMATNARNRRLEPAYKQHTAVDDVFGVVLDVEVTTGHANEGDDVLPLVDAVAATTGALVKVVTADQGDAYSKVYGGLERGADSHIGDSAPSASQEQVKTVACPRNQK